MNRQRRGNDWGFPRWRAYGETGRAAEAPRLCDRAGCTRPGTCPAPKAPNRPERWYFCEEHAAEYNRGWDYFAALAADEAAAREEGEAATARGYSRAGHWAWGDGDGTLSRAERDALRLFDLPADASADDIKAAYRRMAKAFHPDLNPDDTEAARQFHAAQAAYEILRRIK